MRLIKESDHIGPKYLSQVALQIRNMWLTIRDQRLAFHKDP